MRHTRGFTFLEILVSVTIIGLLVSIATVSLVASRNKGRDGAVKSELALIQAEAEVYFSNTKYYSITTIDPTTCPGVPQENLTLLADPVIASALRRAISNSGGTTARCLINPSTYAIQLPLKSDPNKYYCIDSYSLPAITTVPFSSATTRCGT